MSNHGRPLIGLNTSQMEMEKPLSAKAVCHFKYIDAIAAAGGVPIVIPPYTDRSMLKEALAPLSGFCFIGGPDYDPAHYGGHSQPATEIVDGRRHTFDLWLAEMVLQQTQRPVLGICGGHQLINIALGGALVQDLKTEWKPVAAQASTLLHASDQRTGTPQEGEKYRHELKLAPGSLIAKIVGANRVLSNSYHHQAVPPARVGAGLIATAWAPDGVIEALELKEPNRFLLGVQWHPERQADEPAHRAIFEALVNAAKE
jgi:putative glutamine amidotransferase